MGVDNDWAAFTRLMLSREIPSHLLYGWVVYTRSISVVRPTESRGHYTQLWGLIYYICPVAALVCVSLRKTKERLLRSTRSRSSTGALDSFHLCRPISPRNDELVTRAHTVAPSISARSTLAHIFTLFLNGQTHST